MCKVNDGLEKMLLKSYLGKDGKDTFIILFQFLTNKSYTGINVNTYVSPLIDIIHQIWFSSTKSLSLISSVVEREPNSEVPFQTFHDPFPVEVYGKTPIDFGTTAFLSSSYCDFPN